MISFRTQSLWKTSSFSKQNIICSLQAELSAKLFSLKQIQVLQGTESFPKSTQLTHQHGFRLTRDLRSDYGASDGMWLPRVGHKRQWSFCRLLNWAFTFGTHLAKPCGKITYVVQLRAPAEALANRQHQPAVRLMKTSLAKPSTGRAAKLIGGKGSGPGSTTCEIWGKLFNLTRFYFHSYNTGIVTLLSTGLSWGFSELTLST